jgi:hypothetical protein
MNSLLMFFLLEIILGVRVKTCRGEGSMPIYPEKRKEGKTVYEKDCGFNSNVCVGPVHECFSCS